MAVCTQVVQRGGSESRGSRPEDCGTRQLESGVQSQRRDSAALASNTGDRPTARRRRRRLVAQHRHHTRSVQNALKSFFFFFPPHRFTTRFLPLSQTHRVSAVVRIPRQHD